MRRRKRFSLAAIALALLPATNAVGARLQPPSRHLDQQPYMVAVVKAEAKSDNQHVVFKRLELLLGGQSLLGKKELPKRLTIALARESVAEIKLGKRYLLGFSTLRPVPRRHGLFELDPEGPKVVRIPGLGDALLDSTPETRRIILAAAEEKPDLGLLLDAILVQLARPSAASSRFVTVELLLRPELQQLVTARALTVIRKRLHSPAPDAYTRDLLLQLAAELSQRLPCSWLADECRSVLGSYDTQLDLSSPVPALLVTAARCLCGNGRASDQALLATHLHSNNPGVAKAMLQAMSALEPKATEKAVRHALDQDTLHPESRRALEVYLLKIEKNHGDS